MRSDSSPGVLDERAALSYGRTTLRFNSALFIAVWYFWACYVLLEGLVAWILEGRSGFFGELSFPLDWMSQTLAITDKTSFVAGCEIFVANTFVCALLLFPVTTFFAALNRGGRLIRLGIARKDVNGEDIEQ